MGASGSVENGTTSAANFTSKFTEDYSDTDVEEIGWTMADVPGHTPFDHAAFIFAIFMLICCIVGVFGNAMSVLIFTRPVMRCSINILLTGLSFIDLLMLAISIPVFVLPNFDMYFKETLLPSTYYLVIIFGLYQCGMVLQSSSVWIFVLISCERYLAVCHPLKVSRLLSVKRARLALVGVVLTAIGYNMVRFFEYGSIDWSAFDRDQASNEAADAITKGPTLLRDERFYFVFYHIGLYLITHFLGPFVVIAVLNFLIWISMRKSRTLRARLIPTGEDAVNYNSSGSLLRRTNSNSSSPRKLNRRSRTKTTQMIVVVTAMFLCCNVLPFVANIWEAVTPDVFSNKNPYLKAIAFLVVDLSNTLVVFNSASTFLLYLIYCKKYRQLFKWYCLAPLRFLTGDVMRFGGHFPLILSHRSSSFDTTHYFGFLNIGRRKIGSDRIGTATVVSTAVVPFVAANENSQSPAKNSPKTPSSRTPPSPANQKCMVTVTVPNCPPGTTL